MVTMGVFPFQGKTHMVEPGIEPKTSWLVVRSSDHQATRLVVTLSVEPRIKQLELKLIIRLELMSTYEFRVSPSLPPRIFFQWCLGKHEGKFRSSFKAQITTCLEYLDVSNEQY